MTYLIQLLLLQILYLKISQVQMESKIMQQLLQKFNSMFQKSAIKINSYLFNQMKPNLQIPLSVIFKERRINMISNDQKLIIRALKACEKVKVNEEKKSMQFLIAPSKTKLVVQKIADQKSWTIKLEKIMKSQFGNQQYRIEFEKMNNSLNVNFYDEISANQILKKLESDPFFKTKTIYLADGNVFNQIKQAVQKNKKLKKDKPYFHPNNNTFNHYYNYPNQTNFNYPNQFNYPFFDQTSRGPGYTRKAVQSQQQQQPQQNKLNYKIKQQTPVLIVNQSPKKQVQKRIRLNSQNFPSLNEIQKKQEKSIKYKYTKKQIVEIFTKNHGHIQINKELKESNVPVVNPEGILKLQAMKKGGRKSSTFDSPQSNFQAFRKSST